MMMVFRRRLLSLLPFVIISSPCIQPSLSSSNISSSSNSATNHSAAPPPPPQIVWLLSFPNSGTTYTLQAVDQLVQQQPAAKDDGSGSASDIAIAIAANTCLKWVHKECRSIFQRDSDQEARGGPYFISTSMEEADSEAPTSTTIVALTRTHCAGHYTFCGPIPFHKFHRACYETAQIEKWGWKSHTSPYQYHAAGAAATRKKAIHLWRNPMDNIVARWNHARRFVGFLLPSFRYCYCGMVDAYYRILHQKDHYHQRGERRPRIPCYSEFARYVQWHNHAMTMELQDNNMEVLHIHYEDYADNGETLQSILEFLKDGRYATTSTSQQEPPLLVMETVVDDRIPFVANKTYSHYFKPQERQAIRQFLQETAHPKVWEHLRRYLE